MNLTIKNVPENVYKSLKEEAGRTGRSLNAEAIDALSARAQDADRKKQMQRSWPEFRKFVGSLPPMSDSVPLIRADRRRR